jgi:CBS-domain-containing membrane protein
MMATGTTHPPGAATALIAVTGDASVVRMGWLFVLLPALAGALLMLVVAVLVNNLPLTPAPTRKRYPVRWW